MLVSHDKPVSLRARALARVCAGALFVAAVAIAVPAHAAVYDPLNIISCETWRASSSMSVADIQAFLATQKGPLASLITTDYVTPGGTNGYGIPWKPGQPRQSAAQIIYEAAQYWSVNPKMLLATLQKEEGLLTHYLGEPVSTTPLNSKPHAFTKADMAYALQHAMGYGVYKGSTNTFPGFGNQVFNSARGYSQYETRYNWVPNMKLTIELASDHSTTITIIPKTWCTYGLYKYTPYYPQKNFWTIYVRYFGDPLASPRLRPVYRFRNRSNGTYYYTATEAKRYTLVRTAAKKWEFQGISFTCDTSATANTVPLYQMYDTRTHKYLYTVSTTQRVALLKVRPKQWRFDGIVCCVATETSGTAPVYMLQKKTTHGVILTSSASLKKSLTTGHAATFKYLGIAFRLGSLVTTSAPVGP